MNKNDFINNFDKVIKEFKETNKLSINDFIYGSLGNKEDINKADFYGYTFLIDPSGEIMAYTISHSFNGTIKDTLTKKMRGEIVNTYLGREIKLKYKFNYKETFDYFNKCSFLAFPFTGLEYFLNKILGLRKV